MSRLNNILRNGAVTLVFFVTTTLLGFFSRKVMLDHLGTDLLGLNTTLMAFIEFMLLMELGITSAIAVSLYKPLAEKNHHQINEIMWLIKYLYRILMGGILVVGLLLSPLLPFLVEKSNVTLTQTYIAYFIFLICAAANYNFGYGRVLFQADQRNFIPITITNIAHIIKTITQIIVIKITSSYWYWLGIELFFQISAHYCVKIVLYKKYEILNPNPQLKLKELIKIYNDIFRNAKRIAIHHLAGFALKQSDSIVIATMINLSSVTLYGNYYMICGFLNGTVWNILQNAWAGVGNLIATESLERIYAVYKEYLSVNFYIVIIINLSIIFLTEDFIRVWLGTPYVLSQNIVLALAGINILGSITNASAAFLTGYKLFNDIWIPISEIIVNLILSIIGAYYFGIIGVLLGTFGSVCISSIWKPYYLHRSGFQLPMKGFLWYVVKILCLLSISIIIIYLCAEKLIRPHIGEITNFIQWTIFAFSVFSSIVIVLTGVLYIGDKSFRAFSTRIYWSLKHKINPAT